MATWTYELTNSSITISSGYGLRTLSVFNSSSVNGTMQGDQTIAGLPSGALTVTQYQTIGVDAGTNGQVVSGVTITAPSGCTLQLLGQV